MNKLRIVFFGTPWFAAEVLRFLLEHDVDVVGVVSRPDKPKGRSLTSVSTPIKEWLLASGLPIPLFQPEKVSTPDFENLLRSLEPDLFIVVAYGEILKQTTLEIPRIMPINLHTSLLPAYRGAAPIQRALMAGETITGISVIRMIQKMDAGEILLQRQISVGTEENFGQLEQKLLYAGQQALLETIENFSKGKIEFQSQSEIGLSYAPKVEREECHIDWSLPSQTIHDLIRGSDPYPGAWCELFIGCEKKQMRICSSQLKKQIDVVLDVPGTLLQVEGFLYVATGSCWLEILEVQLEGKKRMSASAWYCGVKNRNVKLF